MKKTIKLTIIALCLLISASAFSQGSQKENLPKTDSVALWNAHIDSAIKHTSVSQFKEFIEGIATVKQYPDVKFVDAYNTFIQAQYNAWVASKSKPKK